MFHIPSLQELSRCKLRKQWFNASLVLAQQHRQVGRDLGSPVFNKSTERQEGHAALNQ